MFWNTLILIGVKNRGASNSIASPAISLLFGSPRYSSVKIDNDFDFKSCTQYSPKKITFEKNIKQE